MGIYNKEELLDKLYEIDYDLYESCMDLLNSKSKKISINEPYKEMLGDIGCTLHFIIIKDNYNQVCVVDNQFEWEVNDFILLSKELYYDLEEAIYEAVHISKKLNITYEPFESRYCKFKESDLID